MMNYSSTFFIPLFDAAEKLKPSKLRKATLLVIYLSNSLAKKSNKLSQES